MLETCLFFVEYANLLHFVEVFLLTAFSTLIRKDKMLMILDRNLSIMNNSMWPFIMGTKLLKSVSA